MSGVQRILLLLAVIGAVSSAVTVTPIHNVSANNLVFSGSIPLGTNDSLFFTYYGVDGETNQDNLKNHPLLIVVGKYPSSYSAPEPQLSTTVWLASVPSTSRTT